MRQFIPTLVFIHLMLSEPAAGADASLQAFIGHSSGERPTELDMTCRELDRRLSALLPLSYADRVDFYADPMNAAAIWGGVLWSPAWGYFGYRGLKQSLDRRDIDEALHRIAALRKLKAERHCYER